MTKPNDPIYTSNGAAKSLTKREHFAAMAMQGICANPESKCALLTNVSGIANSRLRATLARMQADALIAELNKETPNENS